jgi:hypothetical protein
MRINPFESELPRTQKHHCKPACMTEEMPDDNCKGVSTRSQDFIITRVVEPLDRGVLNDRLAPTCNPPVMPPALPEALASGHMS